MEIRTFQVTSPGERIDKFLSQALPDMSRAHIQKLIKEEMVLANQQPVKANYKTRLADSVEVRLPKATTLEVKAQNIPLSILYEDEAILVVDKPKQMVVHPAPGHEENTLVNAVLYHCKDSLSGINGVLRPGIVHRIDQDTTGALVICKTDAAHLCLAKQLKEHSITRKYVAIVCGNIGRDTGTIHTLLGRHPTDRKKMSTRPKNGRKAITHFTVLERFGQYTYVECTLETGRTHQIRVHMASIGHPVLGDFVYGSGKNPFHLTGQTLHAKILGFVHPTTGKYMEFEAPLPEYFQDLLVRLRK